MMCRLILILAMLSALCCAQVANVSRQKVVTWDFVMSHSIQGTGIALDTAFASKRLDGRHCMETTAFVRNSQKGFRQNRAIAIGSSVFVGTLALDYVVRRVDRGRHKGLRGIMSTLVAGSSVVNWFEVSQWASGMCAMK